MLYVKCPLEETDEELNHTTAAELSIRFDSDYNV